MDDVAFPTPEKMKHGSRLWRNAVWQQTCRKFKFGWSSFKKIILPKNSCLVTIITHLLLMNYQIS